MVRHIRTDLTRFTFIDIGSGKGAVLLYAADFEFQRIIGIEAAAELHSVASTNIERFQRRRALHRDIQSVCDDAQTFDIPDGPLVVYLYNPFPASVLDVVVERLHEAVRQIPGSFFLLARLPPGPDLTQRFPWLAIHDSGTNWKIYVNNGVERTA